MKKAIFCIAMVVASQAMAATAFLKYQTTSGMNRICVYESVYGEHHITIPATSLCPLSIDV